MEDEDEIELSIDSFIDIIANTVGILIILALLPIVLFQLKGSTVNAERISLRELRVETEQLRNESAASLREKLGTTTKDLAKSQEEIVVSQKREQEARVRLAKANTAVRAAQETHESRLAKGRQLRKDLETAGRERSRLETTISPEDRKKVAGRQVDELQKTAADLARALGKIQDEVAVLKKQTAAAQQELARLRKTWEPRRKELAALQAQAAFTVAVLDPVGGIRGKVPVLVECFRPKQPKDALAAVRLVTPDNYRERDKKYYPRVPGEDVNRIRQPDSQFQGLMNWEPSDKQRNILNFRVRPRGYEAFRQARKLALQAGWQVTWVPIPPGDYISLGR